MVLAISQPAKAQRNQFKQRDWRLRLDPVENDFLVNWLAMMDLPPSSVPILLSSYHPSVAPHH
jgi:hypothetical protein